MGLGTWVWDYGTLAWVLWFFVARNDDAKVCGGAFFCLKTPRKPSRKIIGFVLKIHVTCPLVAGLGIWVLGAMGQGLWDD